MKHSSILLAVFLTAATVTTLPAAEEADPAMAVLKRMREQLRTVMLQQQKTEADRAALEAEKIALEAKNAELTKKLEALLKLQAMERTNSEKTITDLKEKNSEQSAEVTRLDASLAKWKVGYQKLEELAKGKEAERAKLADKVVILDRRVADYQRKNDELFKIGSEVLARYEGFGLGTAITAREPFTRLTRVKLENLVQEYSDKLAGQKVQPASVEQPASQR